MRRDGWLVKRRGDSWFLRVVAVEMAKGWGRLPAKRECENEHGV